MKQLILTMVLLAAVDQVMAAETNATAEKPNFVFIIADDLTFRDLGCYGGQAHTPNIDQFATEGMQFLKCFQTAPMCSPTRHNIYTGLYPVKSGAYPNHTFVEPDTKSVVQYLKPQGYRVALSGKTHVSPKSVFDFEYSAKNKNPDLQAIDTLFKECRESSTPFCLFACSNEPHTPWDKGDASKYPPEEIELPPYIADTPTVREGFSRYLAEISYYDQQVGDILSLLEQHDLSNDTMVIVVSEQGNSMPFAKWTCYDHGLQSAMLVRWPGKVLPSTTSNAIVEYTDVLPTFLEAAGAKIDESLDGKSMLGLLQGKTTDHKDYSYGLMTTRGINDGSDYFAIRSIRNDRYRFIWNPHHTTTFHNACTTSREFRSMVDAAENGDTRALELVNRYQHRSEFELFDCENDPMQLNNLAANPDMTDVREELYRQLQSWLEEQGDDPLEVERVALIRQGRYKGLSVAEADAKASTQGKRKSKNNKAKKKAGD